MGFALGPPAKDMQDPVYAEYRGTVAEQFRQAAKDDGGEVDARTLTAKVGGATYDRYLAGKNGRIATVLIGVQNGRCVAYWYVGLVNGYEKFTNSVGRAEWK